MLNEKQETSSVSSMLSREQVLKLILEASPEVLLAVSKQFGIDSDHYMIAERFIDLQKREHELLIAKRDYLDLCSKKHMQFGATAVHEIAAMERNKAVLKEQLAKMGLN